MAIPGEETSAAAEYGGGGGGAGGKFRKRPFRRAQTTPYDRPPTALRNPSWISKLVVDPASKLINAGAKRFFASIFRKALPSLPAPPPQDTTQASRETHQESGPNNHGGNLEPDVQEHGDGACDTGGRAFSELELLLKQKTFTRSEIDRLTELLHSKAVDSSVADTGNAINVSRPASEDISIGLFEDNRTVRGTPNGITSTAVISSKAVDDDVASPAELAKYYMGSRQSKVVSQSVMNYHSQTGREMVPYVSQSPIPSLPKRHGLFGVTENSLTTPRSRGRSAVYNMARTPYPRVRRTDFQKGGSSTNYLYSGPSSSQSRLEHGEVFGSKQVSLKRRSSALDDDIGSFGPIRRIRQKSNLLYSNGASLPDQGFGSVSATPKQEYLPAQGTSKTLEKNLNKATPSTSRFLVPTKSSETAAKILEHIDKLSPKEKTSESKRAVTKDKSPFKLTSNMLHGQALRSLERLDSSRLLQSAPNTNETVNHSKATLSDAGGSNLLKMGNIENSPMKAVDTVNHVNHLANSERTFSWRDTPDHDPTSAAPAPEKKRAFKMSAPEDSFELDDDIEVTGFATNPLSKGKEKQEASLVNGKSFFSEELSQNKPAISEMTTPSGLFNKKTDKETLNGVNSGGKYTGNATSVVLQSAKLNSTHGTESGLGLTGPKLESLSSPTNRGPALTGVNGKLEAEAPLVASPSTTAAITSSSNGKVSPNTTLSSSVLAASSSEGHAITNISNETSSISAATVSVPKASSVFGSSIIKPESSIFSSTTFSTTSAAFNVETSDLKFNSENGVNIGNLKDSTAATSTMFGFNSSVMPTSTTTQPQGSPFSTGSDSIVSEKPPLPQSAYNTGSQTISSQFSSSTSSPVIGISGVTTFSLPSATAPATKPFGLDSSAPTSAASAEINKAGSSIFAFGASSASSLTTSSGLLSNGVTTTPSFGVSPVSPAPETKAPTFSTSAAPLLFSSSESSLLSSSNACGPAIPGFGNNSAASTSTTTTPVFGLSGSSAASSSSITTTGLLSFTSSSTASTTNNTASTVFNFGSNSAAPSSTSTAPVFNFGGSSASSTSSTAPGLFSFKASSASSSSSITPGVFNFNGSSASSSSSTTPGVFNFTSSSGAPSSTSTTPAVFTFSSATPSVFSFSSSSASSAAAVSNPSSGTFNFGTSSSVSSQASQVSAVSGNFTSTQNPQSAVGFSSSPSFTFGASSSSFSTSNASPTLFGTPGGASSGPMFGFGTSFGNTTPSSFTASPGNDQMTMEDTMAEDPMQNSAPALPVFSQPANSPTPTSFVFGSPNPNPSPFQFGVQQNQAPPQNPSPFQASGSFELGDGGSFSLGSSGPTDKSGRKIVKISRNKNRRK